MGNAPIAPQGWYTDDDGTVRWWDGTQWTDKVREPAAPARPTQPSTPKGLPSPGSFQPRFPAERTPALTRPDLSRSQHVGAWVLGGILAVCFVLFAIASANDPGNKPSSSGASHDAAPLASVMASLEAAYPDPMMSLVPPDGPTKEWFATRPTETHFTASAKAQLNAWGWQDLDRLLKFHFPKCFDNSDGGITETNLQNQPLWIGKDLGHDTLQAWSWDGLRYTLAVIPGPHVAEGLSLSCMAGAPK